jgi:hypothetical protein
MSESWRCPFCNQIATLRSHDISSDTITLGIGNKQGLRVAVGTFTVCPNEECKELSFTVLLHKGRIQYGNIVPTGEALEKWPLIPSSSAKSFPDYVPVAILKDYKEACLIKDLSPKASATLSRRCLQGMIRDFWNIKNKRTLKEEIDAIKNLVDPLTWKAIDGVRNIGNIGAHMEQDINLIIEIDTGEADHLIGLIETLINDWYIAKNVRQQRLKAIQAISKEKGKKRKTT